MTDILTVIKRLTRALRAGVDAGANTERFLNAR